jgi:hypothetical protein
MTRTFIITSLAILFSTFAVKGQYAFTEADVALFDNYIRTIRPAEPTKPTNELLVETALHFLASPYAASTLEINDEEQLVVNLREFDCATFIENCIALSKTAKDTAAGFDTFCNHLKNIRYRNGHIDGFLSRLHYTSDWMYDNSIKKNIEDRTKDIGGVPLHLSLSFISEHPEAYTYLKKHPEKTAAIAQLEDEVNGREGTYYFIPKEKINECASKIENGDIICFTTLIKGLDISHLGIAYRQNGTLGFIHASTKYKKVTVEPHSLAAYCHNQKSNTGIIVLKVL